LAFDGIGYGEDGKAWGGEFLIADYLSYTRAGNLSYFPLPGGDLAVKEPWRTAVSLLNTFQIALDEDLPPIAYAQSQPDKLAGVSMFEVIKKQLRGSTNIPMTSSMGRLFDGVASLIGICHKISYEGQAAIELEALADPNERGQYTLTITEDQIFQPAQMIGEILDDLRNSVEIHLISARFHNTISELALEMALRLQDIHQLNQVALSGGVWQNMSLLRNSYYKLQKAGFKVLIHRHVPANDGGLALGQAVIGQKFLSV
jgi:hydrogenase maturation protein HypF